jgi:CHAD domain-containing protein
MASRSYALQHDESLPDGIRRIAIGRIDHALDELRGATDSGPEEAVHEARKDMKKLRALLRLVRGEVGDKFYRRESLAFRDAGRELAGVRDADVMLATLAALAERYPDEMSAEAAGPLRQALEAHRIRTSGGGRGQAAGAAVEILEEARKRVPDWPVETDGFAAVEDGLGRIYRQGRRGYRATEKEASVENVHEWRKRVKDLWYHLTILRGSWKPVMNALADEAHELSDRLGDDHDLAVLLEWTDEHAGDRPDALDELVARRRGELEGEALGYGRRLYADKPGAFVDRVEGWWRAERASVAAQG